MPLKTKMLKVVLDSNQKTEVVLDSDHEQDKNLFDSTNCHSAQLNGWFASNDKLFSYSHICPVPLTINNDLTEECSYLFYF